MACKRLTTRDATETGTTSVALPKCSLANFEQSLVFCNFMAVRKVEVTNAHYTLYVFDGFQAKFGVKTTKISQKFPQVKLQNLRRIHVAMPGCSESITPCELALTLISKFNWIEENDVYIIHNARWLIMGCLFYRAVSRLYGSMFFLSS